MSLILKIEQRIKQGQNTKAENSHFWNLQCIHENCSSHQPVWVHFKNTDSWPPRDAHGNRLPRLINTKPVSVQHTYVKVSPVTKVEVVFKPQNFNRIFCRSIKVEKSHKKRVGQRRKFETRYIRNLHWSYGKTSKIWILYVFFQYLVRAELYSDYEKLECPRKH